MKEYKYFCEKYNYGTNIKNSYNKHKEVIYIQKE